MLKPSMQELMKQVGNRYLLVNLAAQRARDMADEVLKNEEELDEKTVQLALNEIADGSIVYCPGPRVEPIIPQNHAIAAGMLDIDDDEDIEELNSSDAAEAEEALEQEFGSDDIPEEDR